LLGWSLGANHAANAFGTAVASRMVKFRDAVILCAGFVILGAVLEGGEGMATYSRLSSTTPNLAFVVTLSAGLSVALMSVLRLPVSTSQAVVGAVVVLGVLRSSLDSSALVKVLLCWLTTPIGAALLAILLYYTVGKLLNRLYPSLFLYDRGLRWALILAGSYAAYALGANNAANVSGVFVGAGMLSPDVACWFAGGTIALGVLTYSRSVMMTLGRDLVHMNAYTAFIAVLAEGATLHLYAWLGVPVSTTQAIVGAVVGMGLIKGGRSINARTLGRILFGWLGTPVICAGVTLLLYGLFLALRLA